MEKIEEELEGRRKSRMRLEEVEKTEEEEEEKIEKEEEKKIEKGGRRRWRRKRWKR